MAKKQKKRSRLVTVAVQVGLCVVAVSLSVSIFINYMRITEKQQELEAVNGQLEQRLQQSDELNRVLESGSDLEIIERVARDKLGYAKPNERVFVDVTGQ